jgi:hypothetical protein
MKMNPPAITVALERKTSLSEIITILCLWQS